MNEGVCVFNNLAQKNLCIAWIHIQLSRDPMRLRWGHNVVKIKRVKISDDQQDDADDYLLLWNVFIFIIPTWSFLGFLKFPVYR